MTTADDPATLHRLTARLIRTDHPPHVETAICQGRASDRYYRFRLVSRKAPVAAGISEPTHGCYGLYLCKGAILTLTKEAEDGSIREDAPFTARLVHMFHFSRPGMSSEELRGERELRNPMLIEFHERQRPADAILDLGPRLLGPLPEDLADSLLPKLALTGNHGTALASHIFATWLGGVPLPPLEPPAAQTGDEGSTGAGSAMAAGWLSSLLGLWNRVLGSKAPASGAVHDVTAPEGEAEPKAAPATGGEAVASGEAVGAAAAAPKSPSMPLPEAWAQYELRVQQKDVKASDSSDLEQAWFRELLRKE